MSAYRAVFAAYAQDGGGNAFRILQKSEGQAFSKFYGAWLDRALSAGLRRQCDSIRARWTCARCGLVGRGIARRQIDCPLQQLLRQLGTFSLAERVHVRQHPAERDQFPCIPRVLYLFEPLCQAPGQYLGGQRQINDFNLVRVEVSQQPRSQMPAAAS